jgi:hypothetical protein
MTRAGPMAGQQGPQFQPGAAAFALPETGAVPRAQQSRPMRQTDPARSLAYTQADGLAEAAALPQAAPAPRESRRMPGTAMPMGLVSGPRVTQHEAYAVRANPAAPPAAQRDLPGTNQFYPTLLGSPQVLSVNTPGFEQRLASAAAANNPDTARNVALSAVPPRRPVSRLAGLSSNWAQTQMMVDRAPVDRTMAQSPLSRAGTPLGVSMGASMGAVMGAY